MKLLKWIEVVYIVLRLIIAIAHDDNGLKQAITEASGVIEDLPAVEPPTAE